jgi:hypothetical protein
MGQVSNVGTTRPTPLPLRVGAKQKRDQAWYHGMPARAPRYRRSAGPTQHFPSAARARAARARAQLGEQVDRHARAAKRRIPAHDLAYQPILDRRSGRAD